MVVRLARSSFTRSPAERLVLLAELSVRFPRRENVEDQGIGHGAKARRANIDGRTADLLGFRPLSLGELAKVLGGEQQLGTALRDVAEHGGWFTGAFGVMLDAFRRGEKRGRARWQADQRRQATEWRDRILGTPAASRATVRGRVQHFSSLEHARSNPELLSP